MFHVWCPWRRKLENTRLQSSANFLMMSSVVSTQYTSIWQTTQWTHHSIAMHMRRVVYYTLQVKLEGTHRVRIHMPYCSTLTLTLTFDLSIQKPCHFYDNPRSFPIPSLNTLGSFVFELCCGQTYRPRMSTHADRHVGIGNYNRRTVSNA